MAQPTGLNYSSYPFLPPLSKLLSVVSDIDLLCGVLTLELRLPTTLSPPTTTDSKAPSSAKQMSKGSFKRNDIVVRYTEKTDLRNR